MTVIKRDSSFYGHKQKYYLFIKVTVYANKRSPAANDTTNSVIIYAETRLRTLLL